MEDVGLFFIFAFQDLLIFIYLFIFIDAWSEHHFYLHFCPKNLAHNKSPIQKFIQKNVGTISHTCGNVFWVSKYSPNLLSLSCLDFGHEPMAKVATYFPLEVKNSSMLSLTFKIFPKASCLGQILFNWE